MVQMLASTDFSTLWAYDMIKCVYLILVQLHAWASCPMHSSLISSDSRTLHLPEDLRVTRAYSRRHQSCI